MNECGFFTVIGLCLLLVASIVVLGAQQTGANYSYSAADYQAEQELQNAADGALVEAVDKFATEELDVENFKSGVTSILVHRPENSELSVKAYARYGNIDLFFITEYISGDRARHKHTEDEQFQGIIFLAAAERDNPRTGKKMYRRALAYVLDEEDYNIIHYLNSTNKTPVEAPVQN